MVMQCRNRVRMAVCLMICEVICTVLLCGCIPGEGKKEKIRDLDFTVLGQEMIPKELLTVIEERKTEEFRLTYRDTGNLYIVIGYGQQEMSGYSIAVNALYLTEQAVCVSTSLLGPDASGDIVREASCPYIVIKTELREETVIFE